MRSLLFLLAVACHPIEAIEPAPKDGADRTELLHLAQPSPANEALFAVDLRPERPRYPAFGHRGRIDLVAVHFRCSIEELGLREGPLALLETPGSIELPRPASVVASFVEDGTQSEWAAKAIESWRLDRIDLPEGHLCDLARSRFTPHDRSISLADPEPAFAVRIDDERALVATAAGRFFSVSVRSDPIEVGLPPTTPHLAALSLGEEEVLLIGSDGAVVRGKIDSLSTAPSFPIEGATAVALAGDRSLAVAATDDGRILALSGDAWVPILETNAASVRSPSVAWLGADRFLVAGLSRDSIYELAGGRAVARAIAAEPTLVTSFAGQGIAGTEDGRLFRLEGAELVPVDGSQIEGAIKYAAPWRSGLIYGGLVGLVLRNLLIEWSAETPFCPLDVFPFSRTLVPLSDRALLVLEEPKEAQLLIKVLIDEEPRLPCLQ